MFIDHKDILSLFKVAAAQAILVATGEIYIAQLLGHLVPTLVCILLRVLGECL
jgi:hypothetical protein